MEEHYSEQFHAATLSDPVAQNEATAGGAPAQPKRPAAPPVNFGNIPDGLKDDNRWTVWFYGDRHGAPTKIPVMADAAKKAWNNDPERRAAWNKEKKEEAEREGREWNEKDRGGASSTDTETWSSFDDAKRTYKRSQYNQKYRYDGVGIMLDGKLDENGLTLGAIDLDKVVGNPEREARAAEIIEAMDSYTEVSPSGKGYRIFFKTDVVLPTGGLIHDGVEFYSNIGRFLTVTGQVVDGRNEIKEASDAFIRAVAEHIPQDVFERAMKAGDRRTVPESNDADWDLGPCPEHLRRLGSGADNNDLRIPPDIEALREVGPILARSYDERSKWLELVESIAGTIAQWPDMEAELVSVYHGLSSQAPGYGGDKYPHDANEKKLYEFIGKARARYAAGGAIRTIASLIHEGRELHEAAGGSTGDSSGEVHVSVPDDADEMASAAGGAQVSSGVAGNGSSGTGNGSSGSGSGGAVGPRQPFKYTVGSLSLTAKAAAGVLVQRNAKIYQFAGRIVFPTTNDAIDPMGRKTRKVSLLPAEVVTMERVLSEHMEWVGTKLKTDPATGKMKLADVHIDPPKKIAATILDMRGEAGFPPLTGVFNCPTLRHDGSIVSKRGYDERTGQYIDTDVVLPPIPNQPTKDDALAALGTLKKLYVEFPFVYEPTSGESPMCNPSMSVALSGVITAVIRGMLKRVPIHGATAPAAGTGKSYLWDIMYAIQTGTACPVIPSSPDPQETEKRLVSELLSGAGVINLDNVNGTLSGNLLCQMASQDVLKPRILGKSESPAIQNRSTIFFSGNNVTPSEDLTRRVVMCSLDRQMESPEKYKFKRNPMAIVLANRGLYVAAVLTIVKAYIAAWCPDQKFDPVSGFEDWSKYVRSPLVWLGEADPAETMKTVKDNDPKTEALAQFMSVAKKHISGAANAKTAADILALAPGGHTFSNASGMNTIPDPVLQSALEVFCGGSKRVDAKTLGYKLRANRDKICNGMTLKRQQNKHTKLSEWYID